MKRFIETAWNGIMDQRYNPLRNLPIVSAHLVMQLLAWMWSGIFSVALGSYFVFGITAFGHALVLLGIFTTYIVFQRNSLAMQKLKQRSDRSTDFKG